MNLYAPIISALPLCFQASQGTRQLSHRDQQPWRSDACICDLQFNDGMPYLPSSTQPSLLPSSCRKTVYTWLPSCVFKGSSAHTATAKRHWHTPSRRRTKHGECRQHYAYHTSLLLLVPHASPQAHQCNHATSKQHRQHWW